MDMCIPQDLLTLSKDCFPGTNIVQVIVYVTFHSLCLLISLVCNKLQFFYVVNSQVTLWRCLMANLCNPEILPRW